MSSPAVADAERAGPDLLPKQFEHGWEAFAELVPADVAGAVLALAADPGPLADALLAAHGGATLIHGDLRDDNLGFDGDRIVLIDWDLATAGTPTVEFAWYLAQDAWRIDATHDELEADHRAAHGDALADDEVELGHALRARAVRLAARPQRARAPRPGRDGVGPRGARLVGAARPARARTRRRPGRSAMTGPFRHTDAARTIVFGTGALDAAADLLGEGYTLLTTARAAGSASRRRRTRGGRRARSRAASSRSSRPPCGRT